MNIDHSATIGKRVTIGKEVQIWSGVIIKWKSVIGDGCKIGSRTVIQNSHIGNNVIIGKDCVFKDTYVGDNAKILPSNMKFNDSKIEGDIGVYPNPFTD